MQADYNKTSQKFVIAIDAGNSGTKVGLVNTNGEVVASAGGRYETHFSSNGAAELDPADWCRIIFDSIHQVINESRVKPVDIVAIATTGMWSVTVAVDENANPLMNAISWMDTRCGKYSAKVVKGFPMVQGYGLYKLIKWVDIVGFPPILDGTDSLAHILFIKNEHPEIYAKTYKFLEPMDYINMCLTGKAHATASSNIAVLLIDNRRNGIHDYHPWTLKISGVDRNKLPDLLPVEGIVGKIQPSIAKDFGLSPDTVVVTAANDNGVALIGSGAIGDYDAVAVLGTSGMLVFHTPDKKTDLMHSLATIPAALNDRYIFSADTGNTGRVIDSFLMNFVYGQDSFTNSALPADIYLRLNQAAARVPVGSEGVLFLPWFTGGGLAPTTDQFLRGGFINLTAHTSRDHLARAMLEGIAYNWRWLKESAEALTKNKFTFLRLTGGGAVSDIWSQILADVIGIPMYQEENPTNNTLLGIAFLAFNRLGLMSLDEIPNKVKIKQIFTPIRENHATYNHLYSQFRQCTKQLKPIFHSLNKTTK